MNLKDITLVCFDTRNVEAAIESMRYSLSQVQFNQSILFTKEALLSDSIKKKAKKLGIKIELVTDINSISEYSYFVLVHLEKYINTQFCLITQWDSWIIDKKNWDYKFLNFDYIGAIWPNYKENQIGNGGFSLRSKKFLKSTKDFILNQNIIPEPLIEDDFICREKRFVFERKYQIKFSDIRSANKFSVEGNGFPIDCFGFHSMSNFHEAIKDDSNLSNFINKLINENFMNRESYDLAKNLLNQNRIDVARLIISKRYNSHGISKKHVKIVALLFYRKSLIELKKIFSRHFESL